MTVGDLVNFLSEFPEDCPVTMLTCPDDNPMFDTLETGDIFAIRKLTGERTIVLVPKE